MKIIDRLIELLFFPIDVNSPLVWLFLSWIVWGVSKFRNWNRPTLPVMLIYTASTAISYIKGIQEINACMRAAQCFIFFNLLSFIAEVAFWFIILYVTIHHYPKKFLVYGKDRWLGLVVVTLVTWHLFLEAYSWVSSFRLPLSATFLRQTFFWHFLPWLIWLFFGIWQTFKPRMKIILISSVPLILTTTKFWYASLVICEYFGMYCNETMSLISFLAETIVWFLPLYGLSIWISKLESPNLSPATS